MSFCCFYMSYVIKNGLNNYGFLTVIRQNKLIEYIIFQHFLLKLINQKYLLVAALWKKKKKNGGSLQAKSIWRGRHSTNIAACGLKLILISETTILTSRWLNRSAVWNLVCPWEHKPEGTREKQRQSFSNLLATGRYHRSLTSSAAGCCRLPTWWFPHEWQEKLQGNVRAMWQMRLTFSKRISSLKPAVPKKHYQNLCSYT